MRFFRNSRTFRTAITVFWGSILLLYSPSFVYGHSRRYWQVLIWIVLAVTQLATAWTYVEVTKDALVSHFLLIKRSTPIRAIRYVGQPRSRSRWLVNLVEVETMLEPPTFIAVEQRDAFLQALYDQGYQAQTKRYVTGQLGLST